MGLIDEPGKIKSGEVLFNGRNLSEISPKQLSDIRGNEIAMIFQDPYASPNSRMTVTDIIGEGISTHHIAEGAERQERIYHLIHQVGLKKEHASRYPHEFSGGQRQRKGIACSLAVEPDLVICDKPISGLDVSNQAQVVNMMLDLQEKMGLTYLFIAHDLSMGKYISDRIGVMYLSS